MVFQRHRYRSDRQRQRGVKSMKKQKDLFQFEFVKDPKKEEKLKKKREQEERKKERKERKKKP